MSLAEILTKRTPPAKPQLTNNERRELMPLCTEFIDDIRKAFGAGNIQRIKAEENGVKVELG